MRSMTGYGAAAVESDEFRASVTARSLNHRYLDLTVHTPRRLQALEPDVKRLVQARVQRGRVEVSIQASLRGGEAEVVLAAPAVIGALVQALRRIQEEHGLPGELRVADIARFPGVLELAELGSDLDEDRRHELLGAVEQALGQLEQMRPPASRRCRSPSAPLAATPWSKRRARCATSWDWKTPGCIRRSCGSWTGRTWPKKCSGCAATWGRPERP
jgi:uncharacterized protein (TIGR00255 family)